MLSSKCCMRRLVEREAGQSAAVVSGELRRACWT
jgi:hypothetical protein